MLDEELDELKVSKSKSAVNVKKNITDTLNKLVHLIIQLNKLSKDETMNNNIDMTQEDKDIIEAYNLGVNAYIVKPVDFDQFVKAVTQLGFFWMILNQPPK